MNIKLEIVKQIDFNCPEIEIDSLIIESADNTKGDYCLPCFSLAKTLRKSPMMIANEIQATVKLDGIIEKTEVVNGYLNFFLNKQVVITKVMNNLLENGVATFVDNRGDNKTICIDYSSVNLAKYMHIGHLSTTIIGESIARIFESFGYKIIRMNYVGDYGTPFGKMIAGYRLWGNKNDVEERGIDAIQDLYVEFCKHEDEPEFAKLARDTFKQIEDGDPETLKIYDWFLSKSIDEAKKLTSQLFVNFDDWRGENYYSKKIKPVLDELVDKNLLQTGEEGAKIIDLSDHDLGVSVITKSDGTSLYATRDLATACDRYKEYNFEKCFYVTDVSQKLHFSQVFKVLELLGKPFYKDLVHIYYGRIRLPEGKIASRKGKQALLKDIIEETINNAKEILADRDLPNKEEIATKVGIGAVCFLPLKNEKTKDSIFDIKSSLSFDGETSPYLQYTYARACSILRKFEELKNLSDFADYTCLNSDEAFTVVKIINNLNIDLNLALEKLEPSIISRTMLDLAKSFNKFYQSTRVLEGTDEAITAKINLVKAVKNTLAFGLQLICIPLIEKM